MRTLAARPITRDTFAPYGWLIDATGHPGSPINAGSSQRIDGLSELSLGAAGGQPCLAIFRAEPRDLAGPWRELERHALGTQTFIPLDGARCVVLVALGGDRPDPSTLAAFMVGGGQGVTLRAGTWHHGLIALEHGDFVVLERSDPAGRIDCDIAHLAEAVAITLN
jgi:ureidoglycolate lyase